MRHGTQVESALSVLDYTKSSKEWFDSRALVAGYHTVSIGGQTFKGQRDPEARLAKIDYDFTGKRVLDVGCSNGGLLHALAGRIGFGAGVDFNARCINAANTLKAINGTANIHFYTFDLDKEDVDMLRHFVLGEPVDVCFFLNLSLWVKRWKTVFESCSRLTRTMVFESHGNESQQRQQLEFVRTIYSEVRLVSETSDDDPTYANRQMFLCEGALASAGKSVSARPESVKAFDEAALCRAYEKVYPAERVDSINFFPDTHESVVAEVNGTYIVKVPRPHRAASGLEVERAVTDLIRDRVEVAVPQLEVHTSPALLARYPKLPGAMFDKARYAQLAEADKDALAGQLARFIAALHAIPVERIQQAAVVLAPSWQLSLELIEEELGSSEEPAVKALLKQVVTNHRALEVPAQSVVFGHFDLHGGNILLEDHKRLSAVIDFGNCKLGDLHQDLSVMNLSSPELVERILEHYRRFTGRKPNPLLIQHYTTVYYLNLLAGLKRRKSVEKYDYWFGELNRWYDHLLRDRAVTKLRKRAKASAMPPHWRKWLASNLMKGSAPADLQRVLRENGLAHVDVAVELELAHQHPYVQAAREVFASLEKRNWLLRTCNQLAALDPRYAGSVEVRPVPGFDVFVREYYSKHLPVVLTGAVDHWPALGKWTPEYLREHFGDRQIEVQAGRESDRLYERNAGRHKKKMLMSEFVTRVLAGAGNDIYMTANNTRASLSGLEALFEDVADFGMGYRNPRTLQSGNLLWFGPQGTFTPLHHDLTNNMLVQILGRKKVTLVPAFQVPWLYNDAGVFSAADFPNFDAKRHPLLKHATPVELTLHPGQALFIPIGWWHCVESLDVSISISFTNFNAPNQFSSDFPRETK